MAVLALLALPLDLPAAQPFRAPVALMLVAYMIWHGPATLRRLISAPWVLLIPAVCAVSALWATDPVAAFRHAVLILFAILAAATLSTRLDISRVLVAVVVSQAILAVASLVTMTTVWVGGADGSFALVGVFPHKNVAGLRMVFLTVASLFVLLTPGFPAWCRAIALTSIPMAAFIIFRSVSTTAQVLILFGVPLVLFFAVAWRVAAGFAHGRLALVWISLSLGAAGLLMVTNMAGGDPVSVALDAAGKDRTLTGRTELWQAAGHVIDDHPGLGVGAGNYWQADNGRATSLAQRFGGRQAQNFSFHNLLIEVRVHLGVLGVLTVFPVFLLWLSQFARAWSRLQTPVAGVFVVFGAIFALRALFESELFRPLTFTSILFWVIGFVAIAARSPQADGGPTPSSGARPSQG